MDLLESDHGSPRVYGSARTVARDRLLLRQRLWGTIARALLLRLRSYNLGRCVIARLLLLLTLALNAPRICDQVRIALTVANLRIVLLLLTATVAGSLLLLLAVTGSSATIAGRLGAKFWRGWLRYLPAKWILGPWVPWFSCRLLRLRRLLSVGISLRLRSSIRTSGGLILVTLGLFPPRKINGLTHCSDSNRGSC